jgi:KDO2-lipid IV(A) lauroyltransferase
MCVLQALSLEACASLARTVGWLSWNVFRIRRRVTEENLRHAYPHLSQASRNRIGRQMWQHLYLFIAELAHLPRKVHETNWRDFVELERADELMQALLSDRPLMLISAHFGNFELGGYVLGLLGFPTYSVARVLDNPFMDRYVTTTRRRTGQHIVPKKGGYDQIVDVLSHGGTMSFLADQYAGSKGCWVEFFGRPASAHKAIGLLALTHQAQVAIAGAWRTGGPLHYRMALRSMGDPSASDSDLRGVRELTDWYTQELESMIRLAPEQYWWLHRRWKDNRPATRRRLAA